MRLTFLSIVSLAALHPAVLLARGDGTFGATLRIGLPGQVSIAAGDFNRDGKRDLATTSGSSSMITILLQGRTRLEWERRTAAGRVAFHLSAADLDGDGDDDLVLADPGGPASVVKCRGDGSFEKPLVVPKSSPTWPQPTGISNLLVSIEARVMAVPSSSRPIKSVAPRTSLRPSTMTAMVSWISWPSSQASAYSRSGVEGMGTSIAVRSSRT